MAAYYNEHDPFCAQWLRNLISAGHIAPGDVDERSISDVRTDDVRGYVQCHFFAGIGVWSYALRLAGWHDDRPAWTGSAPCQPWSAAGAQLGATDDRHLWPELFRLIRDCRPPVVLGEQVASKAALGWLDLVFDDLEGAGYACGAADTCAAGVGAPHIRQRLYWVGHADGARWERAGQAQPAGRERDLVAAWPSEIVRLAHPKLQHEESAKSHAERPGNSARGGPFGFASARDRYRFERLRGHGLAGFWADADWLRCRPEKPKYPEGRWRPVEPGTFPLAHGPPARVGRLRAYGNALCAPQAAEFVGVVMEVSS